VPNELPVWIEKPLWLSIGSLDFKKSFVISDLRAKGIATMKIPAINETTAGARHTKATDLETQSTVLVATNDPEIQKNISALLQLFPVKTLWAKGLEEVKFVLARESVAACFCGFWLVDGTYRDVVRHLRLQPAEIPAIIVCAASCPNEYRDYLAALNMRAFDFICHPYRKSDIERILLSAMDSHNGSEALRLPSPASSTSIPDVSGLRRAS
jgi:CheY-like chemotaxis protein